MTVGQQQQDLYGARLDRKNIPPPLSISIPNLQQHYVNTFPKSAPAQTNNSSTDLMQLQLQMMLQNNELSKNPGLQTQFSSPLPQMYSPTPVSQAPGPLDSPNGDNKNSANRYKTELCRPYEESGGCKYGEKCQFAHGLHELRDLSRHPKYKTDLCRTFHTIGFCPYGPRCHFIHNTEEKRAPPISPGPHNSGSNATLQNLPALLSLLQQSNVNKLMSCLRKMQLQLGANSTDEVLQYLNFAVPNLMSPPNTPNMFSFPEYMVPAAQALNQASRSTNNIHSYFNFNLAMKDQHLCSLISAAQISASTAPPPVMPPVFGTPPNLSPAVTPPLSSCESSPLTEVGEMYANQIMAMQQQQMNQQMNQQQMINQQQMMSQQMQSAAQMTAQMNLYQEGYQGDKSTEYMTPGRVIKHSDQDLSSVGKRLPIFNQLSISDPVF